MKKIRKTIAFLLLGTVSVAGNAERVSLDMAAGYADGFFRQKFETKGVVPGKLTLAFKGSEDSSEEPPFYVFNNSKGGFVMIAGDTQSTPVLAYSLEDSFHEGELPSNVRAWMDNMESHINYLRQNGIVDSPETPGKWKTLSNEIVKYADPVILLETPKWNQGAPYNKYCPTNTYTGCVATAMAEILWYHKWPDAGVGTLDSYTYTGDNDRKVYIEGYDLGHKYNWSIMPSSAKGNDSSEGVLEIATLMHDCGVMVQAMYGSEGTGAYSSDVAPALVNHMKYDAGVNFLYASWFSTDEWLDMLYDNLDRRLPIFYSAANKEDAGHAFVLDGYASDGTIHINFGWGGSSNGYYVFPEFSEFSEHHDMIIDLKPDEGGRPVEMLLQYYVDVLDMNDKEIKGFAPDVDYKYEFAVFNMSQNLFNGILAVGLFDHDDVLKGFVSDTANIEENRVIDLDEGRYWIEFSLDKEPEIGDKLRLMFCGENNGDWRVCSYYKGDNYDVYIADSTYIDESTRLLYDKVTGILTVDTKYGVEFSLTDSDGADVTETAVNGEINGTLLIDTRKLQKGASYILLLKKDDDMKQLTIKL